MSISTTLTRMWLTRSVRPFRFVPEYDSFLPYEDCGQLGLYVHIPFCRSLCHFCPYCKTVYQQDQAERYLDSLLGEIALATAGHKKRQVTSLYFGGGSPALLASRLGEVVRALEEHFVITQGVGVELHPEDVTVPVLKTLREAGVTKLSIGVQSFQEKYQRFLGRAPVSPGALGEALAAVPFETVSFDFIFALPGQTARDLEADVELAFQCGANHVALYPFIQFTFTESSLPVMGKREKRVLLDRVTEYMERIGCVRTSIWTFAKDRSASYSSMTRENFLGFGCSAATLLSGQFKINTFSPQAYGARVEKGQLPTALTLRFTRRQRMVYFLFWTAYSTWVDPESFSAFFGESLSQWYGLEFWLAQRLGWAERKEGKYHLTAKGVFAYHYYEGFYTLRYIDHMWNTLGKEAFPSSLSL